MGGGIIPLRRATSSRYDGRLEQESAGQDPEARIRRFKVTIAAIAAELKRTEISVRSRASKLRVLLGTRKAKGK
jgi:hypothetical protein